MKHCFECGSEALKHSVVDHELDFGLAEKVMIHGADRHECTECGEATLCIPRPLELRRAVAEAVATKPATLTPWDVSFLRKFLELSQTELGDRLGGIRQETISRWEDTTAPQKIGGTAERLLRILVLDHLRGVEHPSPPATSDRRRRLEAMESNGHWHIAA